MAPPAPMSPHPARAMAPAAETCHPPSARPARERAMLPPAMGTPPEGAGRGCPAVTLAVPRESSHRSQQGGQTRNWVCGTAGAAAPPRGQAETRHAHHIHTPPRQHGGCTGTSDPEVQGTRGHPGGGEGGRHRRPRIPQCPPLPPPCPTFPRSCQSAGLRANKLHLAGWRHPSPASRRGRSVPRWHDSPAARGAQPREGTGPAPRPSRHLPGDRRGTGTAQPHHAALPAGNGTAKVALSPVCHSRPRVVPGDALRVGRALRTEGQG